MVRSNTISITSPPTPYIQCWLWLLYARRHKWSFSILTSKMYRLVNIDAGGNGGGDTALHHSFLHGRFLWRTWGEIMVVFCEDPRGDFSEFAQLWHHIGIPVVFFYDVWLIFNWAHTISTYNRSRFGSELWFRIASSLESGQRSQKPATTKRRTTHRRKQPQQQKNFPTMAAGECNLEGNNF